ncbi:hypothetical protein ZTR_05025 [Talaromyces verruculosus]|nr:hypothetical protein ZTR_05025 [Talaromyces verruculosus]
MSEQEVFDQRSGVANSDSVQSHGDSDDEPMVHETREDYGPSARAWRDQLIADGADPESIIFQSTLRNQMPRLEGESSADFEKRCVKTMFDMKKRGITVLNDQWTTVIVASTFVMAGGRRFDLGPGSGVTKREFREFREWCAEVAKAGEKVPEVPERWLKYEKQAEGRV